MSTTDIIGLAASVAALIYLLVALVFPERLG
ncbi:MAG: potassium-transporting ATPase subunit F [Thermoleophilia bacterium]|nr:potassium-transporting ATPase subunit F [Thermoleophilia bacterium]